MNSPKMELSPWLVFSLGFLAQALVILADTNAQDGMFQFFPPLCPCYFCAHLLILLIFCAASGLNGIQDSWNKKPSNWRVGTDPCGDKWNGISCTTSRVTAMLVSAATRYYHIRSFPSSHPFYRWAIHHSFCCCCCCCFVVSAPAEDSRVSDCQGPFQATSSPCPNCRPCMKHFDFYSLIWFDLSLHTSTWIGIFGICFKHVRWLPPVFFVFLAGISPTTRTWAVLFLRPSEAWVTSKTCAQPNSFKEFQLSTDFNIFAAWIVPWLICSPTPPQDSCRLQLFWRNTERTRTAHQA